MAFESRVVAADPSQYKTPLLAVLVPRGDLPASLAALDKATSGALGRAYRSGDFTGKKDDVLLTYADGPVLAGAADRGGQERGEQCGGDPARRLGGGEAGAGARRRHGGAVRGAGVARQGEREAGGAGGGRGSGAGGVELHRPQAATGRAEGAAHPGGRARAVRHRGVGGGAQDRSGDRRGADAHARAADAAVEPAHARRRSPTRQRISGSVTASR